jgi:hypothetical protein
MTFAEFKSAAVSYLNAIIRISSNNCRQITTNVPENFPESNKEEITAKASQRLQ